MVGGHIHQDTHPGRLFAQRLPGSFREKERLFAQRFRAPQGGEEALCAEASGLLREKEEYSAQRLPGSSGRRENTLRRGFRAP